MKINILSLLFFIILTSSSSVNAGQLNFSPLQAIQSLHPAMKYECIINKKDNEPIFFFKWLEYARSQELESDVVRDFDTIIARDGCAMDKFFKSVDDFYTDFLKWDQIEFNLIKKYADCVIALKQKIETGTDSIKNLKEKVDFLQQINKGDISLEGRKLTLLKARCLEGLYRGGIENFNSFKLLRSSLQKNTKIFFKKQAALSEPIIDASNDEFIESIKAIFASVDGHNEAINNDIHELSKYIQDSPVKKLVFFTIKNLNESSKKSLIEFLNNKISSYDKISKKQFTKKASSTVGVVSQGGHYVRAIGIICNDDVLWIDSSV